VRVDGLFGVPYHCSFDPVEGSLLRNGWFENHIYGILDGLFDLHEDLEKVIPLPFVGRSQVQLCSVLLSSFLVR